METESGCLWAEERCCEGRVPCSEDRSDDVCNKVMSFSNVTGQAVTQDLFLRALCSPSMLSKDSGSGGSPMKGGTRNCMNRGQAHSENWSHNEAAGRGEALPRPCEGTESLCLSSDPLPFFTCIRVLTVRKGRVCSAVLLINHFKAPLFSFTF